jgi:butyryl-CoA dehydrogenase
MYPLINDEDLFFQLFDVLEVGRHEGAGRYGHCDEQTVRAVLKSAFEVAVRHFLPIAATCDEIEARFINGKVVFPPGVQEAVRAYVEAGFLMAGRPFEEGGMQLPLTVANSCMALIQGANPPLAGFPFSTDAVANVIAAVGTAEQKLEYLPPLREGQWLGVFGMSEPNAGSSLGDLTTSASLAEGGHYLIRGNKMWISGAGNDFCENQVHLVPARIQGAPAGPAGVSLFLVPRFRKGGVANDVVVAGLNKKMGYRAMSNTVLNFGESGDCHGWLIGNPGEGLRHLFVLINEGRLWVGMGAVMIAYTAYLQAVDYAKTRRQGRSPNDRRAASQQVTIICHADVRRMLMAQKTAVEGGLSLVLYCAHLVDEEQVAKDAGNLERARALESRLGILTPVAKSWPSEFCLEANKLAIQVLGGYGYSRDFPMERLYRDARLNAIHEGTHGVQANDLVSRKLGSDGGRAFRDLLADMRGSAADLPDQLDGCDAIFLHALDRLEATADTLIGLSMSGQRDRALLNAVPFLDAFGHVVIAWRWLVQAKQAIKSISAGRVSQDLLDGKLFACRNFIRRELPRTGLLFELVTALEDSACTIPDSAF